MEKRLKRSNEEQQMSGSERNVLDIAKQRAKKAKHEHGETSLDVGSREKSVDKPHEIGIPEDKAITLANYVKYCRAAENLLQDRFVKILAGSELNDDLYPFQQKIEEMDKAHDDYMLAFNNDSPEAQKAFNALKQVIESYKELSKKFDLAITERLNQLVPESSFHLDDDDIGKQATKYICQNMDKIFTNENVDRKERIRVIDAIEKPELAKSIINKLKDMLPNNYINTGIRGKLAEMFGVLEDKSVIEDLKAMLPNGQIHPWVRRKIAETLGELGDKSVVADLKVMLLLPDNQLHPWVGRKVVEIVGKLGDESTLADLQRMFTNRQLSRELHDRTWKVISASKARLGARELVPMLQNLQIDHWVRGKIAETIGELGDKSVVADLKAMLPLPDNQLHPLIRGKIAETLGKLGDKSIVGDLKAMLPNEEIDRHVRRKTAETIGVLGDKSVVADLVKILKNEQIHSSVRMKTAETIGVLGDKSIVRDLVKMLPNEQIDHNIRFDIARTINALGDKSIVGDLVKMLPNKQVDSLVQYEIAAIVGKLGDESIVGDLQVMLKDKQIDRGVRGKIAETIAT